MIVNILIVLLVVGVVFLVGNLVMARRENRQLQEDLSKTVPFRESQFARPHVPKPWRHAEVNLEDSRHRDTPLPNDPAS